MNLGIIAVHTDESAIFGKRSEVEYERAAGTRHCRVAFNVEAVDQMCRPSLTALDRKAEAMIVLSCSSRISEAGKVEVVIA
jgi:hypothetical protein